MHFRRTVVVIGSLIVAATGLAAMPADAAAPAVNLSRPFLRVNAGARPMSKPDGTTVLYSSNWSGYAALPKKAGDEFTSITGAYNVPSVNCSRTPNTFSYHWIGLDGWDDATVEQDGIAADCSGTTRPFTQPGSRCTRPI